MATSLCLQVQERQELNGQQQPWADGAWRAVDHFRVGEELLMMEILFSRSLYVKTSLFSRLFQIRIWRNFWQVKSRQGKVRQGKARLLGSSLIRRITAGFQRMRNRASMEYGCGHKQIYIRPFTFLFWLSEPKQTIHTIVDALGWLLIV
jgi:hypothetical protein